MAKKKKKEGGPEIPEWVVTFGDMMSLLLCFFILLQMFSELKREHEYQRVITAVKEAFGYNGGVGVLPVDDPPLKSMIEVLETLAIKNNREMTRISSSPEAGMDGPHVRVKKVREGIVFTIGGPASFEPESAEIKPAVRAEIMKLVPLIKGRMNKIDVIGHAAAKYLSPDAPWTTLDDLSYARAVAVKNVLLEAGIDDRVFRLQAAGMREPVDPLADNSGEAAENRRVEVILTEVLVDELNGSTIPGRGAGG